MTGEQDLLEFINERQDQVSDREFAANKDDCGSGGSCS